MLLIIIGIEKPTFEAMGLDSSRPKAESREYLENTGKMFADAAGAVEKICEQAAAAPNEIWTGIELEAPTGIPRPLQVPAKHERYLPEPTAWR